MRKPAAIHQDSRSGRLFPPRNNKALRFGHIEFEAAVGDPITKKVNITLESEHVCVPENPLPIHNVISKHIEGSRVGDGDKGYGVDG